MTRIGLPVRTNGLVQLAACTASAFGVVGADDHAVGLQEVVDGGALLQELRVRDDRERVLGQRLRCVLARRRGGAHRHGATC